MPSSLQSLASCCYGVSLASRRTPTSGSALVCTAPDHSSFMRYNEVGTRSVPCLLYFRSQRNRASMTMIRQQRTSQDKEDLRYRQEGSMLAPQYLRASCRTSSILLCRQRASIYSCAMCVLLQSS